MRFFYNVRFFYSSNFKYCFFSFELRNFDFEARFGFSVKICPENSSSWAILAVF